MRIRVIEFRFYTLSALLELVPGSMSSVSQLFTSSQQTEVEGSEERRISHFWLNTEPVELLERETSIASQVRIFQSIVRLVPGCDVDRGGSPC
jgi:hypothetical protein